MLALLLDAARLLGPTHGAAADLVESHGSDARCGVALADLVGEPRSCAGSRGAEQRA